MRISIRSREAAKECSPSPDLSEVEGSKGAEPFIADVSDASALAKAFHGADAAYVMIPPIYEVICLVKQKIRTRHR